MKAEYTIRFVGDGEERTVTLKTKATRITNGVRARVAKIGDLSAIASDMSVLNAFMDVIFGADLDYTDALTEDTDAVIADFFQLFTAKTS